MKQHSMVAIAAGILATSLASYAASVVMSQDKAAARALLTPGDDDCEDAGVTPRFAPRDACNAVARA